MPHDRGAFTLCWSEVTMDFRIRSTNAFEADRILREKLDLMAVISIEILTFSPVVNLRISAERSYGIGLYVVSIRR